MIYDHMVSFAARKHKRHINVPKEIQFSVKIEDVEDSTALNAGPPNKKRRIVMDAVEVQTRTRIDRPSVHKVCSLS